MSKKSHKSWQAIQIRAGDFTGMVNLIICEVNGFTEINIANNLIKCDVGESIKQM